MLAQPALHEGGFQHADYLLPVGMTGPQVTATHGCKHLVSRLWHHWLLRGLSRSRRAPPEGASERRAGSMRLISSLSWAISSSSAAWPALVRVTQVRARFPA